ncbi:DNA mismatch repair protein MutS [Halonotius aquaticus]|uniref:DNA mismatch repair protein MutS n=1 Tax=Halonotius aquaticus TaxID=2216978 RepID=A0A3A6QDM3_9EURY|nr:DNA mismatch repair protein MutS [Halonotius aquaticus]RJX44140.1 DNA mismatch repair protein MutS [Halonotius aquaticus]
MSQGIVGQFHALKADSDADLVAMQCGDFYEFFDDDAECVAAELDLTTSTKSSGGESYPMAGVPVSELQPYLTALVERGYTVAVADQFEDDSGDFYREITRRVTPGTLLETADSDAQYLAAVVAPAVDDNAADSGPYGLAFADITTGQFLVTEVADGDSAVAECYRFDPVELLPGPAVRTDDAFLDAVTDRSDAEVTLHTTDAFAPGRATHAVTEQFGDETADSIGLDSELARRAAGAILAYVAETGVGVRQSMTRLQPYTADDHLTLDATTQRNLELVETMQGDSDGSLLATLDHTETSPGRRLLREWLTRPRRDHTTLDRRLDSVAAVASAALSRQRLQETLAGASDLERLASRVASGSAGATELLSIRDTLALLPDIASELTDGELADSPLSGVLADIDRDAAADLRATLGDAIVADPPQTVTQGELFKRGYDDDLDDLIDQHEAAKEWLDGLADRLKQRHGLTHVSVGRNKTDGYYVQVGQSEADAVPDSFSHVKTLKNSQRFVTDELAEREREILRLEEQRGDLEYELFEALRETVAEQAALLQDVGRAIAELDVYCSLATHAAANGWCRPTLAEPGTLDITAGRHPVVEQTTEFVPNDLRLDDDRGFLLVTGPNMSGKSTYMRQAALITLLAQVGSFVPADAATVGVVDGIYTRVGALDELAQGRSTFMVEMQELSNILHSATDESLVILDEVGRGTATYDGISIAWAATEYIHNRIGCHCLFATHYHELTALASHLDRVGNVHVAVANEGESDEEITFLRTVEAGATDRSYGIHVADLAGVPDPVVGRARDVLDKLRSEKAVEAKGSGSDEPTQAVFDLSAGEFRAANNGADAAAATETSEAPDPAVTSVLSELEATDIDETPPVELMAKVQQWQEQLADADDAQH